MFPVACCHDPGSGLHHLKPGCGGSSITSYLPSPLLHTVLPDSPSQTPLSSCHSPLHGLPLLCGPIPSLSENERSPKSGPKFLSHSCRTHLSPLSVKLACFGPKPALDLCTEFFYFVLGISLLAMLTPVRFIPLRFSPSSRHRSRNP